MCLKKLALMFKHHYKPAELQIVSFFLEKITKPPISLETAFVQWVLALCLSLIFEDAKLGAHWVIRFGLWWPNGAKSHS
jgi:hypothetical protein